MTLLNLDIGSTIHMIGIGGISMSGLAEIALSFGYNITGSDAVCSDVTKKLEKNGIKVYYEHSSKNVVNANFVVYTAAIKPDNIELVTARDMGIPTIERSDFLGELTKHYSETIAICGTHGKTTTTSMLSLIFIEAGKDPSIQVGAELKQIDGNYKVGNSEYFIIEACEYVESFLKFFPKTATVLNIEEDHLDYYKNLDHIKSAFKKFIKLVPKKGNVVVNGDDVNCLDIVSDIESNLVTFGISNDKCDWIAKDIHINNNEAYSFTAFNATTNMSITIDLSVPGRHNVYNALAAIATSYCYNIASDTIKRGLENFSGASRRFEYVGNVNGATIYDDYAHHPTEIMATIEAAMDIKKSKLWVVFQPHTYSRTKALFNEFTNSFGNVDNLILTDIYAAREAFDGETTSQKLAIAINEVSNNCTYISNFEDIVSYLKENVRKDDVVLTLGAGTITKIGYMLARD